MSGSSWLRLKLVVSIVAWFGASACCTASSKRLLSSLAPHSCAMAVTTMQFICAALLGVFGGCFRSLSVPPRIVRMHLLGICFSYTAGFCLLNLSLNNLDASFAETVRSLEPLFTSGFTYAFGLRSGMLGSKTGTCLISLLSGAALVMWAQPALSPRGLLLGMLANAVFALRSIFVKMAQDKLEVHNLPRLDGNSLFVITHLIGLGFLLPLALLSGAPQCAHVATSRQGLSRLVAGSALGFALYNRLSLSVLMLLNAVSHSVLNALRRAVTVVSAALLLHSAVSPLSWMGISVIITSSALYVLAAAAEKREEATQGRAPVGTAALAVAELETLCAPSQSQSR